MSLAENVVYLTANRLAVEALAHHEDVKRVRVGKEHKLAKPEDRTTSIAETGETQAALDAVSLADCSEQVMRSAAP